MQQGDPLPPPPPRARAATSTLKFPERLGKRGQKDLRSLCQALFREGSGVFCSHCNRCSKGFFDPVRKKLQGDPPELSTLCAPRSPMMMVQALTSPISFLSATRSEVPGPGPGPGEGEDVGPGFPRPPGCCMWPVMSLSRLFPAFCATPSVRPAASLSVGPSVGALAALAARDSAHRRAHALARSPGPRGPRAVGSREGRKEGPPAAPSPTALKGNSLSPNPNLGKQEGALMEVTEDFLVE